MTDTTLSLVLAILFILAMAGVRYFKTLEPRFWSWATTPIVAGVIAGLLVFRFLPFASPLAHLLVLAAVMTATMVYVRRVGDESEPLHGLILGAVTGMAALAGSIQLDAVLPAMCQSLLAATVAGLGITIGTRHVGAPARQLLTDVVTFVVALAAAAIPSLVVPSILTSRELAIGIACATPLFVIFSVFQQWPAVRKELRDEAQLGFFDAAEVRSVAHPLLRLGRNRWVDLSARREYVRLANRLARRKHQQRGRPGEVARLHQLEIIQIRMQLQEIAQVERDQKRIASGRGNDGSNTHDDEIASDTMATRV